MPRSAARRMGRAAVATYHDGGVLALGIGARRYFGQLQNTSPGLTQQTVERTTPTRTLMTSDVCVSARRLIPDAPSCVRRLGNFTCRATGFYDTGLSGVRAVRQR